MGVQGTFQITFSSSGASQSFTGYDNENGVQQITQPQVPFPANSNAAPITLSFNVANCELVYLKATQNCTLNASTNNNASAINSSIHLIANIPFIWGASSSYWPNPFNGNTNGAFLTCNAATLLDIVLITT